MKISIISGIIVVFLLLTINLYSQEYKWAHSFGTADWEEGLWIDHDEHGNIYAIGYFLVHLI